MQKLNPHRYWAFAIALPWYSRVPMSGVSLTRCLQFSCILQGAERKTRDEERRAAKRKMTATGRKKIDELYHPVTERSEFYGMQDVAKPPVLFTPSEDMDGKLGMDLQSFYGHDGESFGSSGGGGGGPADIKPFLLNATTKPATPTLKFHNHFPPDVNT